jgi:enoyl-CoA hydratase
MTDMVTYGLTGGVAVITLNRPDALNALSPEMLDALDSALGRAHGDEGARAVVITGAGRAFCAGADIRHFTTLAPAGVREYAGRAIEVFRHIEEMGKPVIAAINGVALGGGCELAMACTLRIAADTARLGQPEINLGIIPGYGGTQRLARLVGRGRALELLLTGDAMTAEEAWRIGLVNRVVPAASLAAEARRLAQALATRAPIAVRYIIDAVNEGLDMPLAEAQVFEATLFGLVSTTEDMREGTRAFLEKRQAAFKGR